MTEGWNAYGNTSPGNLSPDEPSEVSLRIPKNKSTGNLLLSHQREPSTGTDGSRTRFSFDSGNLQEINNLKKAVRSELDHGLSTSGLRRIRRAPSSRAPTLLIEDELFIAPPLLHSQTLPVSGQSSRSVSISRSTSTFFVGGRPASPILEDLQRFPTESLHSFSFARQSEDFLHSKQAILEKSVDFLRDHKGWVANPGLATAQAKVSGDAELKEMMELLQKAKVVPSLDIKAANAEGVGRGPVTGPANFDSKNIFEKSFSYAYEEHEEAILSPTEGSPELSSKPFPGDRSPRESEERFSETRPDSPRKFGLKRTYTDVKSMSLQRKLIEALAQPYSAIESNESNASGIPAFLPKGIPSGSDSHVHSHSSKWAPPAQVVFRTEGDSPWTIVAANDLACLTFGVTRAEVRSLSILGLIQPDRRDWLENKLKPPEPIEEVPKAASSASSGGQLSALGSKGGLTARLLSKAPSRLAKNQGTQADEGSGDTKRSAATTNKNHPARKSRGVLLCGEILPIQKRDGRLGAASFWVMEKRGGLIWVVQEVIEDVAYLEYDSGHRLVESNGDVDPIWGEPLECGTRIRSLIPKLPLGLLDDPIYDGAPLIGHYTACTVGGVNVPATVAKTKGKDELRVSSLPHIAGIMVLHPDDLKISSSNPVFSMALFGYDQPNGMSIDRLIPNFGDILDFLTEEDDYILVDGLVIPEFSFRRARALQALREGKEGAANIFLRPAGLPAKHRDGTDIMVDVQLKVVRSESLAPAQEDDIIVEEDAEDTVPKQFAISELVYALWITYSRQLHSAGMGVSRPEHPLASRPATPPPQPQPTEESMSSPPPSSLSKSPSAVLSRQGTRDLSPMEPLEHPPPDIPFVAHEKKTIDDFVIIEEMGSGAYGEVKLARYRTSRSSKVVIKYVTKKKILVDTWTRDRRLGTVPLEIHVLDFLRRPGMKHPNIVEMVDFFEDDINYYIEMLPHGIPGMDLFDYIELRTGMIESEARDIFRQVVSAIHHLHVKAQIVHRDIKDENVVLDGENKVKLIDFGSAAYIKNGPFDVFVGTIDYAAPEVLQGKAYGGPEQDVWALGILLYTIVFKENPFYNIDEILDHPLRLPPLEDPFSEDCIDLIQAMLNRDVDQRYNIEDVQNHPWLLER